MQETIGDRIRAIRTAKGLSQAQLASMVGFKQQSLDSIEKGETKRTGFLIDIAKALDVRPEWLQTGQGESDLTEQEREVLSSVSRGMPANAPWARRVAREPETSVIIKEVDVSVSAGHGVHMDGDTHPVVSEWKLPNDFIRSRTNSPSDSLNVVRVVGDSMIPLLLPGDRVMVDKSDTRPSPPGLFVIFDGLGLVIKRIEIVAHSNPMRFRLMSENAIYESYECLAEEAHIAGRVIGVMRLL